MVLSPTLGYACGTWTLTNEHERLILKAKRKMLRPIVQTIRKYKEKKDGKQHENQKSDIEKEKKAKRTPKAKLKKEAALTPIATKIATSPLQKTQTKRWNEGSQDSVFDRNAQKNEMAIGDENSIATRRTMGKESCWLEPRI